MKKLHFREIILFGSAMVYIFFISSSVCNGHILSPKHSLFQAQCLNYFPFLISNSSNRVCDRINYQSFSQVHDFYIGIIFSSTLRTLREILSKIKSPIVIRILLRSSYIFAIWIFIEPIEKFFLLSHVHVVMRGIFFHLQI